jgi:malate dehydrogenase (oxaloacetate-decarboxylating)(NADP+)
MRPGDRLTILDPGEDMAVFGPLAEAYHRLVERKGTPPESAATRVRTRTTVAASMLLATGAVEAAIVGATGQWMRHWELVRDIIPRREGVGRAYALSALIIPSGTLFIADTHVNPEPSPEQLCEMTGLAAEAVRRFGVEPKVALVSHSNFGSSGTPSARRMRAALGLIHERFPGLEVEGEMHADAALHEATRARIFPRSTLKGSANLLIMPTLDAANIAFELLKAAADGLAVGPMLLGLARPVHVVTPSITARGILNVTALAVLEAASPHG